MTRWRVAGLDRRLSLVVVALLSLGVNVISPAASGQPLGISESQPEATEISSKGIPARTPRQAKVDLEGLGPESPTDDLVDALKDKDQYKRRYAAQWLGERKEAVAVPYLIEALPDPAEEVQRMVTYAIVQIGHDEEVLPHMLRYLESDSPRVRKYAAYVIGELGDESVLPALCAVLTEDEDGDVREYAARALLELSELQNRSTVPALDAALRDTNKDVRRHAARALGVLKAESSVSALTEALTIEKETVVQKDIAFALGEIGGESVLEPLTSMLSTGDVEVRRVASLALWRIQEPATAPALAEALADSDIFVRRRAAGALVELGVEATMPTLARTLVYDEDVVVRQIIAEATFDYRETFPDWAMVRAMLDDDQAVRRDVGWTLIYNDEKHLIPDLITAMSGTEDEDKIHDIWRVLRIMTKEDIGPDPELWRGWYEGSR